MIPYPECTADAVTALCDEQVPNGCEIVLRGHAY